jgi:hypothetical protein
VALLNTVLKRTKDHAAANGTKPMLLCIILICIISDDIIYIIIIIVIWAMNSNAARPPLDLTPTIHNLRVLMEATGIDLAAGEVWAMDANPTWCDCIPRDHCSPPTTENGKVSAATAAARQSERAPTGPPRSLCTHPARAQRAARLILQASCKYMTSQGVSPAFLAVGNDAASELAGERKSCAPSAADVIQLGAAYREYADPHNPTFCAVRHTSLFATTMQIPDELNATARRAQLMASRRPGTVVPATSAVISILHTKGWVEGVFRGFAGEMHSQSEHAAGSKTNRGACLISSSCASANAYKYIAYLHVHLAVTRIPYWSGPVVHGL